MPSAPPEVLSVSHLTALIQATLEQVFPSVWVQAEISDLSRPRSGHLYLTLKDERAQIRAVMWRSTAQRLGFDLSDGMQVLCRGELNVYPPRGTYQIVLRQVEPLGEGALQLRLRQLQQKLADEGLFAPERKRPLPRFPRRIAVVTSPTGAAIRDFLEVVRRRWRGLQVILVPSRVQGAGAAPEVARAIRTADRLAADALVVTRGGGSLEDLWAFNEEPVVRAVSRCQTPVVSAIGHEIDVTLTDLAADLRALTPTEAAERVAPSEQQSLEGLESLRKRLIAALRGCAERARVRLDSLAQRRALRRPTEYLQFLAQRLDELQQRAARAAERLITQNRHRVAQASGRLESLSPLAVLRRGYSLTEDVEGRRVHSAEQLAEGQEIVTRLTDGRIRSRVESVQLESNSVEPPPRDGPPPATQPPGADDG